MNPINVKSSPYNAVGNGSANDTNAIQSALTAAINSKRPLYFPSGTYYVTQTLDADVDGGVRIYGDHKNFSIIQTDANIELLRVRHEAKLEHLTLKQLSATQQGVGISVPFAASRGEFKSLEITGFEYGFNGKRTLWLTFSDIELKSNKVGIHLGYGLPLSTWNVPPNGWFNNVINFFNVLIHHGQKGFDLYGMGMTLVGCTTQALTETGISIQGPSSDHATYNNVIINHYIETIPNRGIYLKNAKETSIIGLFAQGTDIDKPQYYAVLEAENSNVTVENSTGQSNWQYNAILRNSTLKGSIAAIEGRYSLDQKSLHKDKYSFPLNHLLPNNQWRNLYPKDPLNSYEQRPPIWLLPRHTYKITLVGIRDGFDPCLSEYLLYYFDISKFILKPITVKLLEVAVVGNTYSAEVGDIIVVRLASTSGSGMSSSYAHIEIL